MKMSTQKTVETFRPVSFAITCESQSELDFFASLFNHCAVDSACERIAGKNLEELVLELERIGADCHYVAELLIQSK